MKSHSFPVGKISALTIALMAAYGVPVFAADEDVVELITPQSWLSIGGKVQAGDKSQLGIFDAGKKNDGKPLIDAQISRRDEATGTWNQLRARNLGLADGEISLNHSLQGDYGVSFDYSRISRDIPYTVNSGLRGTGQLQTVSAVSPGRGYNLDLGYHRDRFGLGFNKFLIDVLELTVRFREERKQGLRPFGTYSGAQANFLVEPIDSRTRQLDIGLNYVGKDLQLQGGYAGSWYDNSNKLIVMGTTVPSTQYLSLPPDNQAHQLFLNGAYTVTPTTKLTMRLARAEGTQDDKSLLSQLPAAQVWAGFPGVTARLVTTEGQFGISARPLKELTLLASASINSRKDKTPHVPYNSQATPDETTPHTFKTMSAKFEAAYRLEHGFKLLGGAYLDIRERSIPFKDLNNSPAAPTNAGANWTVNTITTSEREVPYRSRNKEWTLKGQGSKSFGEEVNASLVLARSKRVGNKFRWTDQTNLVNPLHMADRERDKVGVKLDWTPSNVFSLQAQVDHAKDEYGTNGLWGDFVAANGAQLLGTGIRDGGAKLFSVDATFRLNDSWQLSAWYSRDESTAKQYAYQANFGRDPIRKSNLADTGDSIGVGLQGKATADLTIGADMLWNRSVGKYEQTNFNNQANLVEELPTISSRTLRLVLNATYQMDRKNSVRVDLMHDRWNTNDWTWTMWNNSQTALLPFAYAADGTSVITKNKQSANTLAVRYKFEF